MLRLWLFWVAGLGFVPLRFSHYFPFCIFLQPNFSFTATLLFLSACSLRSVECKFSSGFSISHNILWRMCTVLNSFFLTQTRCNHWNGIPAGKQSLGPGLLFSTFLSHKRNYWCAGKTRVLCNFINSQLAFLFPPVFIFISVAKNIRSAFLELICSAPGVWRKCLRTHQRLRHNCRRLLHACFHDITIQETSYCRFLLTPAEMVACTVTFRNLQTSAPPNLTSDSFLGANLCTEKLHTIIPCTIRTISR